MPNFDPSKSHYLTADQAAQRAHVCIWTIYDWLKSGRVEGVKVNGQWQIPESCLAEALQRQSQGACARPEEHELATDPWQWLLEHSDALGPNASLRELTEFLEEVEQVFSACGSEEIEDFEGHVVHQMACKLALALRSTIG